MSFRLILHLCLFVFLAFSSFAYADRPVNCTYDDVIGEWKFKIGGYQKDCSKAKLFAGFTMKFSFPNIVEDVVGNIGTWTMIDNQAFDLTVANRKWLVPFKFDQVNNKSVCSMGEPSWSRDVLVRQWACFQAVKVKTALGESKNVAIKRTVSEVQNEPLTGIYQHDHEMIAKINQIQQLWKAAPSVAMENRTLEAVRRRRGISKPVNYRQVKPAPITPELQALADSLPINFDWRYPGDGRPSAVTPIRDQGNCGSCYAFSSAAAIESRIRVVTGGRHKPILSPQDIVDCSPYSEGCNGGYPYLIAGKYAEEKGFVEETCNPYKGVEQGVCGTKSGCSRSYTTKYHYVGGFSGACNEALMRLELVKKGPMPISFEVYDDFETYKSGIYHHTGLTNSLNKFNPWEIANHAVLLVGYGYDMQSKTPYWTVKNSWGTDWGEDGFFRIRRGVDECSIESAALSFEPVI